MKNPFLFKKSNGYYYLAYYEEYSGKKKTVTTKIKNKVSAKDFLFEFVRNKKSEKEIKNITLLDFKKIFLDNTSANKKITTQRNYHYVINSFLTYAGNRFLSKYTIFDLDSYLNFKLSTRAPETAHLHRRSLKVIFDKAVSWNYLKENLIYKSIKIKLPENKIKYFTKEDFTKLIENTPHQFFKDLFYFALLTGMRLNEILKCRYSDIDYEKKLIKVYAGKTDKTRYVELHHALVGIIEKYKSNEYLFKKWSVDYISKRTKHYIKKAGIDPALNFKAFRSSFGKFLLDEGINIKYISQQLGHSSVTTTEKHYSKYITSEYKGWIETIQIS